ncbi:MAG: hypothetical protein ACK4YF_04545 [Exilispira sp.]
MKKRKNIVIFSLFLLLILNFIFFESCTFTIFSKKYKSEEELKQYIEKYPLLGFFYLYKIEIKKGFLSIKDKQKNYPLFIINGKIIYSNLIDIKGSMQIGSNIIDVFKFYYNYENHKGYFEDISSKLKYELAADQLKIPKQLVYYIEKSSFLLLLMLKGRKIQNLKNGEIEVDDIILSIKDYKIEKAKIESHTLPLVIYYKNYRRWDNIYYPSMITILYNDYIINFLITDAIFVLTF